MALGVIRSSSSSIRSVFLGGSSFGVGFWVGFSGVPSTFFSQSISPCSLLCGKQTRGERRRRPCRLPGSPQDAPPICQAPLPAPSPECDRLLSEERLDPSTPPVSAVAALRAPAVARRAGAPAAAGLAMGGDPVPGGDRQRETRSVSALPFSSGQSRVPRWFWAWRVWRWPGLGPPPDDLPTL